MMALEERLRAADPAQEMAGYSPAVTDAMLAGIVGAARPRRWGRRWLTVVAAAVLAAGLVVAPVLGFGRGGATAEAAGLLDRAIIAAVDPPTRPDQYWKITTDSISSDILGEGMWGDPDTVSALRRSQRVTFVAVDGSRPTWFADRLGPYVRQVSGPATALPDTGWSAVDAWTTNIAAVDSGGRNILRLPRDPTLLRLELYRLAVGRGHSLDDEVVVIIGDALREGYAPADLRKAFFEVLKTVPGVDVVARNVTLDGRAGVALGRFENSVDQQRELVFDPASGEYIGERTIDAGLDATLEDAVSRELVDRVDPEIARVAKRLECQLGFGGMVTCPSR